ncbi:hypothetical protein PUN28_008450 [Cardiocondyla obscurior]|uniref:Secreted protein n=1 Tax=Cardiocondyla obscurior TaxID=286306 RepID=A0AAW2FZJ1_9HYME
MPVGPTFLFASRSISAEVHFTHSRAYTPSCSSGAALRGVLCADVYTRARAYTYVRNARFLSFYSPCSSLCRSTSLSHSTVGVCT